MLQHHDIYRIKLDQRWNLRDLYVFPRTFEQTYAFIYCLDSDIDSNGRSDINHALATYPWRGGYSYVNIYSVLSSNVRPKDRPKIAEIKYASPGWLDLVLNPGVGLQVTGALTTLSIAFVKAAEVYRKLQKLLRQIKQDRDEAKVVDLKAKRAELRELHQLSRELAKHLKFGNRKILDEWTGDPETTAKILAAHYRRCKILLGYTQKGKAEFPTRARKRGPKRKND